MVFLWFSYGFPVPCPQLSNQKPGVRHPPGGAEFAEQFDRENSKFHQGNPTAPWSAQHFAAGNDELQNCTLHQEMFRHYLLVMTNIAMENQNFSWKISTLNGDFPFSMAIYSGFSHRNW